MLHHRTARCTTAAFRNRRHVRSHGWQFVAQHLIVEILSISGDALAQHLLDASLVKIGHALHLRLLARVDVVFDLHVPGNMRNVRARVRVKPTSRPQKWTG